MTADQGTTAITEPTTLSVAEAAAALSLSAGHVRRLCAEQWTDQGLARRHHGRWLIYPAADPRLGSCRTTHRRRDLEQVAELRAAGVNREHLRLAEARRTIVERFGAFEFGKDVQRTFPQFATALLADGVVPAPGIRRVTLTTVYRWRRAYDARGLAGLVPQFNRRGRPAHEIGPKAWAVFGGLVLGGNRIGIAQAYALTLGEIVRHHLSIPAVGLAVGRAGCRWNPIMLGMLDRRFAKIIGISMSASGADGVIR